MFKKKSIPELLAEMTNEQIYRLTNELTFACHFNTIGYEKAQVALWGNEFEHSKDAENGYFYQDRNNQAIKSSELYAALRLELSKRFNETFPDDWVGWVGLAVPQRDAIKGALKTYYAKQYPIRGMIFGGVSEEKLASARKVIIDHGLTGIFVNWKEPWKSVDLESAFRKAKL